MATEVPIFENSASLSKEAEFISRIEGSFKCRFHKLPMDWQVDGILSREGRGVAIAELKVRQEQVATFPSIILSHHKAFVGIKLSSHFAHAITGKSLPFILFVRMLDGDFWCQIFEKDLEYARVFKANNHPGFDDFENVIDIEVGRLVPFKEKRSE